MSNINFSNVKTAEMKAEEANQAEQDAIDTEARAYLASTDWYLVREMETGVPTPQEIKDARQEARLKVSE
jgi:hypothetical protein|tara:strand:+ start:443 stop:652 length:210 start_codon:yes stop_codon:yes gene_type:complete